MAVARSGNRIPSVRLEKGHFNEKTLSGIAGG
jgi:hypothetical protein